MELYEAKKIRNFRPALNTIELLATKHKAILKSGKPEKEYNKLVDIPGSPLDGRTAKRPNLQITRGDDARIKYYHSVQYFPRKRPPKSSN